MEQNRERVPKSDVEVYTSERLRQTLQAYRERPDLAFDRTTHVKVDITIADSQDVSVWISIFPSGLPPQVNFECHCQVEYAGASSLLPDIFRDQLGHQLGLFLYIEYPRVHWDGTFTHVDTRSSSSNIVPRTQELSDSEQFLLKNAEAIQKAVTSISNGFKSSKTLAGGLPVLYFQKGLSLKEYSGVVLSHAKDLGKSSSSIRAACGLIEGCVQQMLVTSSNPQLVFSDSPGPSSPQGSKFRQELRRWRGRASILNTVIDDLWPNFGQDSCRVYEALIASGSYLTKLAEFAENTWTITGKGIARGLVEPLRDCVESHNCQAPTAFFDPVVIASHITGTSYRRPDSLVVVDNQISPFLQIFRLEKERRSPDSSNQSRIDQDDVSSTTSSPLSVVMNGRGGQQGVGPLSPPSSTQDHNKSKMEEDSLCLPLAHDEGDPGLSQASAGGTSGCHSSPDPYKPLFTDITDLSSIAYPSFTEITGLPSG